LTVSIAVEMHFAVGFEHLGNMFEATNRLNCGQIHKDITVEYYFIYFTVPASKVGKHGRAPFVNLKSKKRIVGFLFG